MLPLGLFLLISHVLAATPPTATSVYDPLRAVALSAHKPKQEICCLRPLEAPEVPNDETFPSFEEWKAKQLSEKDGNKATQTPIKATANHSGESESADNPALSQSSSQDTPSNAETELRSAHFNVPLVDRFNYASLDCSARVHTSHRSAKSSSSILSSKHDRYMLSPCRGQDKFVIVELCEDIRIDTVQLANFEFFSGVFKDFTVSVAKTSTTDPLGWTVVGEYKAKNVRVVQSFHPPTSLRDFYRYIRIDFHTHYGNEFYCPLSLLRVYGLTHLEHWKWDLWEAESKAKREEIGSGSSSPEDASVASTTINSADSSQISLQPASTDDIPTQVVVETTVVATTTDLKIDRKPSIAVSIITETSISSTAPITAQDEVLPDNRTEAQPTLTSTGYSQPTNTSSDLPPTSISTLVSTARSSAGAAISTVITAVIPSSGNGGGESIYRTIMNRLAALEMNQTLYARYVDEQTASIREVMRRLGEDVGRLEGIGKAQAQMHNRAMHDLDVQKQKRATEHEELMHRVKYLADEVALEKRLGIAQLCLLLAVLVFMGLTRGSRGEPIPHTRFNSSVRDWGRRHLSFNGGWVDRFRSPGTSRTSSDSKPPDVKYEFPKQEDVEPTLSRLPSRRPEKLTLISPLQSVLPSSSASNATTMKSPRSRTSSLLSSRRRPSTPSSTIFSSYARSTPRPSSQGTPALSGWPLTNSLSMVGPPKSARQWARSAHLHPVRPAIVQKKEEISFPTTEEGSKAQEVFYLNAPERDDGWIDTDIESDPGS